MMNAEVFFTSTFIIYDSTYKVLYKAQALSPFL
jgi:hypothetical protein